MNDQLNEMKLEGLTAALAYAMGVEPPQFAETANEELTAYVDRCLAGKKADRVFMYNTDAIAQWLYEKYPQFAKGARDRTDLELPLCTVNPPKTPIAFGTMYTGAHPTVHGIVQYEKKLITIDTLFDALVRAGKKVALLSIGGYSMAVIFAGRPIDYFFCPTWPDVNAKAAELIIKDEYDFILCYNANFDDVHHKKGVESVEALAEMRRVLVVGGRACVLEFAPVTVPVLGGLYHWYLKTVMPWLGGLFSGDREAYAYLADSVASFPEPDAFSQEFREAGFAFVQSVPLSLGVVNLHIAVRGEDTPLSH